MFNFLSYQVSQFKQPNSGVKLKTGQEKEEDKEEQQQQQQCNNHLTMKMSAIETTKKLRNPRRQVPAPISGPATPSEPVKPIQEFSTPLSPIKNYTSTRPTNVDQLGGGFEGPYPPRRSAFWDPCEIDQRTEVVSIKSQQNGIAIFVRATNLFNLATAKLEHYDFLRCLGAREAIINFLNQGRNMHIYINRRRTQKFIRRLVRKRSLIY